jgi:transcriptional regulator with XRE-family HTH domain
MARKSRLNDDTYLAPPATRIRERMEKQQLTNAGLAEKVGVSSAAISQFVNGQTNPTLETLVKIANAFDTTTDYLLGRTDDPNVQRSVIDDTGLSDEAVKHLKLIKENHTQVPDALCLLSKIICNKNLLSALHYSDMYLAALQAERIDAHFYGAIVSVVDEIDLNKKVPEEIAGRLEQETEEYERVMANIIQSGVFGLRITRALRQQSEVKRLREEKVKAIAAVKALFAGGNILKELVDDSLSAVDEILKEMNH